jgi:hypothetical protein
VFIIVELSASLEKEAMEHNQENEFLNVEASG